MSNICLCLNNIDIEISHCNERSSMEAWRKGVQRRETKIVMLLTKCCYLTTLFEEKLALEVSYLVNVEILISLTSESPHEAIAKAATLSKTGKKEGGERKERREEW